MHTSTLHPLSHPQRRIWYTEMINLHTAFANLPFTVKYREEIDLDLLAEAVNRVIRLNDGMRIRLRRIEEDGLIDIRQYVAKYEPEEFERLDFSGPDGNARQAEWLARDSRRPFELLESPLYRFALVRFSDTEWGYYFNTHHLISDGWTVNLITRQIGEGYAALARGEDPPETPNPGYLDYLDDEAAYLASPECAADRAFWHDRLLPLPEEIVLPFRKNRTDSIVAAGRLRAFDPDLRERMHAYSREHHASIFKLVLAALAVYINRITALDDVVFATVNHGRETPEQKLMTGMFVATFPVRVRLDKDMSFAALVEAAGDELNNVIRNRSRYPVDQLIGELRDATGVDASWLLNIILVGHPNLAEDAMKLDYLFAGAEPSPLTIHINASGKDARGTLELQFDYHTELFDEDNIDRIFAAIATILDHALADPGRKLREIELVSDAERRSILVDFNDTRVELPASLCVKDMFEEQVARTPDHVAVVYQDQRLTYAALNARCNRLAHTLIERGARPGALIGILPERSMEMIVGLMAVIKTGCTYVPIDAGYPPERVQYMLDDSHSFALLSHGRLREKFGYTGEFIDLDDPANYADDETNPPTTTRPSDLVNILYTSGSTGKPKGVMTENAALAQFVAWHRTVFELGEQDSTTKFASFGFDVTLGEVFPALSAGTTLHVIADDIRLSPMQLNEYFEANNITVAFFPTQFGEQFIDNIDNHSLRWLIVGGEKLRSYTPRGYALMNGYGPTEYTVFTTTHVVDRFQDNIPIGRPRWNTRCYILDRFDMLRPIGIPGELCIAGEGIALGYFGRPDLTAEKFVDDPFHPGAKMYRTGDLCRWLPDGTIEYLGRIDLMVKVRGFRVELGEIEQAIKNLPHITDAVVAVRVDAAGRNVLAGYFVADAGVDIGSIRQHLAVDLPEYMIPPHLMQIGRMPLTPNGKIDRKALPEPEQIQDDTREFVAPATGTEKALAALWRQLLDIEVVGAGDDFFRLGGHSLKAALLQARIQKDFGMQLSLQNIFHNAVLRDLAACIDAGVRQERMKLAHVADRPAYPVSAAQRRLFIVDCMENIGITYNIPVVTMLEGKLDANRLSTAIEQLTARHEVLRTSFDIVDGEPVQIVHPRVRIKRSYQEATESDLPRVIADFIRPFDLRTAPLFRAGLVKIEDDRHLFIFDTHHIVFDGWSVDVFMDELWGLYEGRKLSARRLQYRDFAVWQEAVGRSGALRKQEEYWAGRFADEAPTLNIETDFPRGSALTFDGARIRIDAGAELTARLRALARDEGATIFMVLLSAYAVLLSRYAGQEDVVVGIPASGRTIPELERMIGMFVNSLPIRSRPNGEATFREFLAGMKNLVLEAYDNQDYQLDALVEKLGIARNAARNPLFDVMFAHRRQPEPVRLREIAVRFFDFTFNITKFDLTIEAIETTDTIAFELEYRRALFTGTTVRRMGAHFLNILDAVAANAAQRLCDIDFLAAEEKSFLLREYNDTAAAYPADRTVYELFEEQAAANPAKIAVAEDDRTMTFEALNAAANRFAHTLRDRGVGPDRVVGVMMEQSIEFVVAILGIIKAGGAYLPIDPAYPDDRIAYILENSSAPILVTTPEARGKAGGFTGAVMVLERGHVFEGDPGNPAKVNAPGDLVYIIYTSGSTGRPKGVMITHQGLVNYIVWARKVYLEGEALDFPLYSSISFDLTVTSIFTPLVSGNTIVVYAGGDRSMLIKRLVEEDRVGIVKLTPTHLAMIENLDCGGSHIRRFIVGGEELRTNVAEKILAKFRHDVKIFNEYGPTETVVGCMIHRFRPGRDTRPAVPIGVPADNARIYLLDGHLAPVPPGAAGEMFIAGDGVARGYMNRPEITAERFLPDPFHPGARMYRTGDLAKFLPDGTMEYLGRIDFQVKIRGFRIELGEVESTLAKHPDLRDVVVLPQQDDDGISYLCAYYVAERKIPVNELKTFLAADLPDYMVPSYFIPLDAIPMTPNGKVDRTRLPKGGETVYTGVEYVEPRNDTETAIRAAFVAVLGVTRVGVNDNFFDLGGNSLRAVALVAELRKQFEATMNDVFQYQTVAALAKNVRAAKDTILARLLEIRDSVPAMLAGAGQVMRNREVRRAKAAYRTRYRSITQADLEERRRYDTVLLTGATGFLGAHLLRELMATTDARVVLPVRAGGREEAEARICAKLAYYFHAEYYATYRERIAVIAADLGADRFGLGPLEYADLAERVDCIINSAALVKHYGRYEEFQAANVQSVVNLIAFARTGRNKDIHHVSTVSVGMGAHPGHAVNLFTEYDLDAGQKSDMYYLVTKLEAERKLAEARETGVMSNVYRVGNITFDSRTGRSQENLGDNAFFNVVRAFITLGAVPDRMDDVEFSFVDQVSRAILHLHDRAALRNETFHIRNPHVVKQSDILTAPALGLRMYKVRFADFVDRLIDNYPAPEFRPHIEAILLHFGWLEDHAADADRGVFVPLCDKTNHLLKLTGFHWPGLRPARMERLIIEALRERIDFLKGMPLFAALSSDELHRLARLAIQKRYAVDAPLTWEGEANDYFHVISRGNVEISRHSKSGWLGTVLVTGRGDFLGADQIFADGRASNTAEAILDDVHVYAFRMDDVRRFVTESTGLGAAMIRVLAERVSRLTDLFVNLE